MVCASTGESLPVCDFSNSYLSECLIREVTISNRKAMLLLYIDLLVKHLMNMTLLSAV